MMSVYNSNIFSTNNMLQNGTDDECSFRILGYSFNFIFKICFSEVANLHETGFPAKNVHSWCRMVDHHSSVSFSQKRKAFFPLITKFAIFRWNIAIYNHSNRKECRNQKFKNVKFRVSRIFLRVSCKQD